MSLLNLIKQARTIEESTLNRELLIDLTLKHFFNSGVMDLQQLSDKIALAGSVMQEILALMRKDSQIEVLAAKEDSIGVRYQLTDLGRSEAKNAFLRSGYIGRAPISIKHYWQLVEAQSVFYGGINKEKLKDAFADVVIEDHLLDQLGPALHSGRAILIYGPAGTGKTYICKLLANCLGEPIYLPYAICVDRDIIQFYDPLIHKSIDKVNEKDDYQFQANTDKRLILCERPIAISGGELTIDRLELRYDPFTRINYAPIQLKANNGIYIVDDMGRQRMPPVELFNRWIVPMEERLDYLTLGTGQHFPVPFDIVLMFSTNLHPMELADDAFLRRLGYKIQFSSISESQFTKIWKNVCRERGVIAEEEGILDCVFDLYVAQTKRSFLPCQPRDLIGIALDIAAFNNEKGYLSKENIRLAWKTYFISLNYKGE